VGGLVNGATTGRGLSFVHGQENKKAFAQGCRSPQILLVGGPGADKFLQVGQEEGGIQRNGRRKNPKPRRGW